MFKLLKAFLDKHDVFSKAQNGFRDKHSTQHAIVGIVHTIQWTSNYLHVEFL